MMKRDYVVFFSKKKIVMKFKHEFLDQFPLSRLLNVATTCARGFAFHSCLGPNSSPLCTFCLSTRKPMTSMIAL